MSNEVEGRKCYAMFNGGWIVGKLIKNRVKKGICIVETHQYGTIVVSCYRVRMADHED